MGLVSNIREGYRYEEDLIELEKKVWEAGGGYSLHGANSIPNSPTMLFSGEGIDTTLNPYLHIDMKIQEGFNREWYEISRSYVDNFFFNSGRLFCSLLSFSSPGRASPMRTRGMEIRDSRGNQA